MNHIVIDTVYVFSRNQSKSEQNVSIHIITMCKCMLKVKTAPKHPSLRFENQCMLEGEWMSWNRHACGCDMLKCYALTYIGVFEKSNKLYVLAKKNSISLDLLGSHRPRFAEMPTRQPTELFGQVVTRKCLQNHTLEESLRSQWSCSPVASNP